MRLIFTILAIWLLSMTAWPDPGDSYELSADAPQGLIEPLVMRSRGSSESLQAPDEFQIHRFASRLGKIGAITAMDDGAVYVTDTKHGRVFEIVDRGRDGRADHQRVIMNQLDRPSDIVSFGENIFVADQKAVWRWNKETQSTNMLADLSNMSAGPNRALIHHPQSHSIWIAMNLAGGQSKIIAIDLASGRAKLIWELDGHISKFLANGPKDIWVSVDNQLIKVEPHAVQTSKFPVEPGVQIAGMTSINADNAPAGFALWADHVFVSQGGVAKLSKNTSGGLNVIAVPTRFGHPVANMEVVVDGFLSANRRSAWGVPGPIMIDRRGLFISDPLQGSLWLMSKSSVQPDIVLSETVEPDTEIIPEVETAKKTIPSRPPPIRGSQIETASKIEIGSTIIKDWEAAQKAKAEQDAKETPDD